MSDTQPSATTGPPPLPAGLADERFAVNLREERERYHLSQAEVARQMKERGWKWHAQTVQRVEAGHRKVTIGEAEAIARILHTTADRLTWPGRASSAASQLDYRIARAVTAQDQIILWTRDLLLAQRHLVGAAEEVERADCYGSDKIREALTEAKQVMAGTPEECVEAGREEYERVIAHGEEPPEDEAEDDRIPLRAPDGEL